MRTLNTLAACLCASLLVAGSVLASPDHEEKQRKVKVVTTEGGEVTVIDVEKDLALGETRTIDTVEGKTITVTRSFEDEMTVLVDGEELVLPELDGEHMKIIEGTADGVGDATVRKVFVRRQVEDDCEGDECEERHEVRTIFVGGDSDDIDIEVFKVDGERMTVEDIDIEIDCESDEGDCETKILESLGAIGDEDGRKVVVVKKHVVREGEEE